MNKIFKNITSTVAVLSVLVTSIATVAATSTASAATCIHDLSWTSTQRFSPGTFCSTDNSNGYVTYQTDGNLVWYVNGKAAWNSGTMAHGSTPAGASLNFQSDSNIVIRSKTGTVLWASSYLGGWKSVSTATNKQLSTYYSAGHHYFAHNVNGRDNWSMVR